MQAPKGQAGSNLVELSNLSNGDREDTLHSVPDGLLSGGQGTCPNRWPTSRRIHINFFVPGLLFLCETFCWCPCSARLWTFPECKVIDVQSRLFLYVPGA
eukprot:scaffold322115_cov23-Tisochrysis_lutea.AAC.1